MAITYTGVHNQSLATNVSYQMPVVGEVRFHADTNKMESWTGSQWIEITTGSVHHITINETVEHAVDNIASQIDEEEKDNIAIQDAFKEWQEATKKFRVILALAEENK